MIYSHMNADSPQGCNRHHVALLFLDDLTNDLHFRQGDREVPLHKMRTIDQFMQDEYQDWVDNAPDDWREYLDEVAPIFITCRYGQDEELGLNDRSRDNWDEMRDFSQIYSMSFAIANSIE